MYSYSTERRDVIVPISQQVQDAADICVSLAEWTIVALIFEPVLDVEIGDVRVLLLDEGDRIKSQR